MRSGRRHPDRLSDLLGRGVRPNLVQTPRKVYEDKAARWKEQWPELTVLARPEIARALRVPTIPKRTRVLLV